MLMPLAVRWTVATIRTSLRRRLPYPRVFVMLNDMATAPNDLAGH